VKWVVKFWWRTKRASSKLMCRWTAASSKSSHVLDAVEATVPGGRITEAVRESVRGEVIYDIEVDVRGEKFDLEISPDGTVLDVEESN